MADLSKERRDAIRQNVETHRWNGEDALCTKAEFLALLDALDEAEEHYRVEWLKIMEQAVAAAVRAETERCIEVVIQQKEGAGLLAIAAAIRARGDKPHGR